MSTGAVGPWVKYQRQPDVRVGATAGPSGSYYAQGVSSPPNGGQVTDIDNPEPNDGPWTKYAHQDEIPPSQPLPVPPKSLFQRAASGVKNFGIGLSAVPAENLASIDQAVSHIPYVGKWLTTPLIGNGTSQQAIAQEKQAAQTHGTAQGIGKAIGNVGEFLVPDLGEEAATGDLATAFPRLAPLFRVGYSGLTSGLVNKAQGGGFGAGAAAGGIGGAIGEALPMLTEPLQERGIGKINRVIGALKPDFKRGANPGEGYFQARLGPSLSMGSIAEKAANANEGFGEDIGNAIDNTLFSRIGGKVPTVEGVRPIAEPINKLHDVLGGPGGGSTAPAEDLAASFRPAIQDAAQNGGFTLRDLFDMKKNVARNTGWSDPTQIGLKQARQQIVGGLGDTIADYAPELRPLNSAYRNTKMLAERTADRAATRRPSLSKVGDRIIDAGLLGGGLLKGGMKWAGLGVLPALYKSLPVQTGLASALYYGGEDLSSIGPRLGQLGPAAVLPFLRSITNHPVNDDYGNKNRKSK